TDPQRWSSITTLLSYSGSCFNIPCSDKCVSADETITKAMLNARNGKLLFHAQPNNQFLPSDLHLPRLPTSMSALLMVHGLRPLGVHEWDGPLSMHKEFQSLKVFLFAPIAALTTEALAMRDDLRVAPTMNPSRGRPNEITCLLTKIRCLVSFFSSLSFKFVSHMLS
ncbi:LOW QUALITY PROTEIN: hypothetical protein HID58_012299, partial [Brassica napus]